VVSDVTRLVQQVPSTTTGASYGAAFLTAGLVANVEIGAWNPVAEEKMPAPALQERYEELYRQYRQLYVATRDVVYAVVAAAR